MTNLVADAVMEGTAAPLAAKPYRVLSLDGGGMRGIYTAAFFDRLVTQFARMRGFESLDLGKGFDLITGTSTGAIVGCALAVGRPMDEIVKMYRDHGREIFPHRIRGKASALWRMFVGGRYVRKGDKVLRAALTKVLKETTMLEVFQQRGISLSIPAVLMSSHRSWVFKKTPKSGVRDDKYKLVDVCMASSAAPIFRSLAVVEDPNNDHGVEQVFADGGLWANNPIMVGLADALACAAPKTPIEIFSLGTCSRPEGELIEADRVHRSILGWKMGAEAAGLSITAQEFAFDNMARFIGNKLGEGPSGIGKTTAIKKAIESLGLQNKVTELKATKKVDIELIRELPNISDFGIVFVDDFHRLDESVKAAIADYVKILADEEAEKSKVIIVGINEAGRSLVELAPDLVNRIDTIKVENNPDDKILELIQKGERALNIRFNCHEDIVQNSNGGFYIAQMLCNELCQKADILESRILTEEIVVSFEGAKAAIWDRLDSKFNSHAKTFALGSRYRPEGRAPYLHLLHALANSDQWYLDIRQYARSNSDMRLSVMQVLDKGFLSDLFKSNPKLSQVLHFEERAGKIVVEDPQFLFYFTNMPWQSFATDLGFKQIGFGSKYDFALSFAGEDRDIAHSIFESLIERELSVFYDKNEQHRIAAENVEEYLAPIYSSEAKLVICILGQSYPKRVWTKFESKQFEQKLGTGTVIPVLVDDVSVGLFSQLDNIGYLQFKRPEFKVSCNILIETLIKKLTDVADQGGR